MQVGSIPSQTPGSDVRIDRLSANPRLTESEKVAEASRQFEAMLLRQILQNALKPVVASKFASESSVTSIYQDMTTSHLADTISKSGALGLARSLQQELLATKAGTIAAPHPAHP